MTVFDRTLSPVGAEKETASNQQQLGLKADVSLKAEKKEPLSAQNQKSQQPKLSPADASSSKIDRVPLFRRTDPGFMSPDVIASVRINEQQHQLPYSSEATSIEAANRKARDAAILRFEASSWSATNLKSEKASADVLTRVNIGIGAPIAGTASSAVTTNSKQTAPIVKGAQDWTSAINVKPSKDSADVLVKVKIHDEIENTPVVQRSQTSTISTAPDQPDVMDKVNINAGSVAKNPGAAAKPAKESADVQTPVKIHEDVVVANVAKPSKESADVQTSVKIHQDEMPSQTATPTKDSADVLNSVKINEKSVAASSRSPVKSSSLGAQIQGDKQDIAKPFDKSNSQPSIEPILVDKLPKSNYKNDLDDIITVESQDEKASAASESDETIDSSSATEEAVSDKEAPVVKEPVEIQAEVKSKPVGKTSEESEEVTVSVQITKDVKAVAKPIKESADVLASAKIPADTKPTPLANPTKDSADVKTPVKIHADTAPVPLAKPSKDSADVQTPVKIHAEEKPTQIATPLKDSADVLTPVKIHADAKPVQIAKPSKDSADVQTPVKIHAEEKPLQKLAPLNDSADVLTPVKIHADTKPTSKGTPVKDSADVLTPVKIHADAKPTQMAKPVKDSADVQTPVKIHADAKPTRIASPVKDSADVLTPVKIHAEEKPVQVVKPVKNSADVLTPVKIHAEEKPAQVVKPVKDSADVQTPVKIHADMEPKPLPKPSKGSADVLMPVKLHADAEPPRIATPLKDSADVLTPVKMPSEEKSSTAAKGTKDTASTDAERAVGGKKEPVKAASSSSATKGSNKGVSKGENASSQKTEITVGTVGGVQNDSVKDVFASLVAADVISGVKMYGDRIPASSASASISNSGSQWKSDFDPNRWAPITY